jgi:ankyrin repeat protein
MVVQLKKLFDQASNSKFRGEDTKALLDKLRPQLIHAHEDNELGQLIRSILSDLLVNNPNTDFLHGDPLNPQNPFKINPKEFVTSLLENTVFEHKDIGLDSTKNYDDFIKQNADFDINEVFKNISIKSAKFVGRSWVYFDENGKEVLVFKKPKKSDKKDSFPKEIQMNLNVREAIENGHFKSVTVDDIPKPAGLAKVNFKDLPLTEGIELPDDIDEDGLDYVYIPPKGYFDYLNDITDVDKFIEAAVKGFGFILECYQYGFIYNQIIGLVHGDPDIRNDGATFLTLVFYLRNGYVPGGMPNYIPNSMYPNVGNGPRDLGDGVHVNELKGKKIDTSLSYLPHLRMESIKSALEKNNILSPEEYVSHVVHLETLSKLPIIIQTLICNMVMRHNSPVKQENWLEISTAIISILNQLFNKYAEIKNDIFSDLINIETYAAQLELWVGQPFLHEDCDHEYVIELFKKAHPEIDPSIFIKKLKGNELGNYFNGNHIGAFGNSIYPVLETTKLGFLFPILLINNQLNNKNILNASVKTHAEKLSDEDFLANKTYMSWIADITPDQMHKYYLRNASEPLFAAWVNIKLNEDSSLLPIEKNRLAEWGDNVFDSMLNKYETWDCIFLYWMTKNAVEIEKNQPDALQPWQISLRKFVMRFNLIINYKKYSGNTEHFLKENIDKFNFKHEFIEKIKEDDFPIEAIKILLEKAQELKDNFNADGDPEIIAILKNKLVEKDFHANPNIAPLPQEKTRRDEAFDVMMKNNKKQFLSYIATQDATIAGMELLLKDKVNINAHDDTEKTALYMACEHGHVEIVKFLLQQKNIDINKTDIHNTSPLHIACRRGHTEIVRILLQDSRIININLPDMADNTPLQYASFEGHTETVNILLNDQRIETNNADEQGMTAFYLACERNHENVVASFLQDNKTDINQSSKNSNATPLQIACAKNNYKIVDLLLNDARIKINDINSLIKIAYNNKASNVVISLYKYLNSKNTLDFKESIDHAFSQGNGDVIQYLLQVEKSKLDDDYIYQLFVSACKQDKPDIVKVLLQDQRLINVNRMDNNGCTPLYMACEVGNAKVVEVLTSDPRIFINRPNNNGITPLFIAFEKNKYGVMNVLLKNNRIDPVGYNAAGITPLHMACVLRDTTPAVINLLQNPLVDINKPDNLGRTPLCLACEEGNINVVKVLLADKRLHPNKADNAGRTPSQIAASNYHSDIVKILSQDSRMPAPTINMAAPSALLMKN